MISEPIPSNLKMRRNRLFCSFDRNNKDLFFSLVDYRNNYFTSDDPNKIIEFYNGFENRDELIRWMRERPKGSATIHEVEGNKEIIVVIPTADFKGKYAKECRDNIFKGLHIVFVESGGRGDFYFNSSHNVNVGIRKAMEYNPKLIVFSGDDMYKIDDISVLTGELKLLNNKTVDFVFTDESSYHSRNSKLISRNLLESLNQLRISNRFGIPINRLKNKFNVRYSIVNGSKINNYLFKGFKYTDFVDFGIFSAEFLETKNGFFFDETFINEGEDSDISIAMKLNSNNTNRIGYKIGDMIGSTLGTGVCRSLRGLAGVIYLNFKWESVIEEITL